MSNNCQTDQSNVLGCMSPPDPELIAQGWERRFIAEDKRAQDALEIYEELGHEVRIEPITLEELKEECHGCLVILKKLKAVYTRKKLKLTENNL
jgi:hypothetical protein